MSENGDNGGLLFESAEEDKFEICRIFQIGIEEWNSRWASQQGIVLAVNDSAVEVASSLGGKIMFHSLPKPPDAFKRAAALLVMMALHPFIIGRAADKKGLFIRVLQGDDLRPFAIRFVVDSLPLIFGILDQAIERDGKLDWVNLNNWTGFHTEEMKHEFIAHLYAISKSDVFVWDGPVIKYQQKSLGEKILGVSLTLKGVYGEI